MPAPGHTRYLAPLSLVALAVAFTLHRLDAFDVWYHLAAGRLMVETGAWPVTNTFAFTAPDHRWIDLHWIFQLLLYGAFRVGGPAGCTLLAVGLVVATTLLLYRLARRTLPPAAAAPLMAVALVLASPRLMPRPELVTFLLLAVYLTILEGPSTPGRRVWMLVPLQIVWANVQGLFPLGLVVIGGYWAGATLALLPIPAGWRARSALPHAAWRRLTLVLALATAGCVVNPYGREGALFPLELLTSATGGALVSGRIGELRGPFEAGHALPLTYLWLALLVATALAFGRRARDLHLGRALVVGAFAVLSTQALRHIALFALVAVPALAACLRPPVAASEQPMGRPLGRRLLAAIGPTAVALLALVVATNHFARVVDSRRAFGLGLAEARFPVEAVAFLDRAGITGRPFNCLAMGGFLTWHLGAAEPPGRVFIDGRLETYPAALFRVYFRALDDPKSFPALARRFQPDFVIMYHAWGNRLPLVTYLAAGHGWTLVYHDRTVAIFLPDDDAHRAVRLRATRAFAEIRVARAAAPAPLPLSSWRRALAFPVAERWYAHRYGEFLRSLHLWPEAVRAYERALALDPGLVETRFFLGLAHWHTGKRARAEAEWRDVVRRAPDFAPARRALADAAAGPR